MNRRSCLGCVGLGAAAAAAAGATSFGFPALAAASALRYQNPNYAILMKDLGPDPTDEKHRRRKSAINDGPHELSKHLAQDLLASSKISPSERTWLEHTVRSAFAVAPSSIPAAAQSLVTGVHSGRTGPRQMAAVLSLVNGSRRSSRATRSSFRARRSSTSA